MTGLLSVAGSTPSDDDFELKSLRFNDDDTPYLSFTPDVEGNKKTWTFSCWTKFTTGVEVTLLGAGDSPNQLQYYVKSTGELYFWYQPGPNVMPTARLRDPSAWYHIVLAVDTTQTTAADRVKFYVNGEQLTDITTTTYPAQNLDTPVGDNVVHRIGIAPNASSQPYDGYMAEAYMINGSQITPSYFGETNELTNQWRPKNPTDIKQTVTFGTNGFYLPFSNDALATSFTDSSGTVEYTFTANTNLTCDVLVVGGGGSGGGVTSANYAASGGGGAGGFRAISSFAVASGNHAVTVGAGGGGSYGIGTSGGNSIFSTITAAGGGGGGSATGPRTGLSGGSGGGGAKQNTSTDVGGSGNVPSTSPVQGYAGGDGFTPSGGSPGAGGGGGGSGGIGETRSAGGENTGGTGGVDTTNSWQTDSSQEYAGGGGGGGRSDPGSGGGGGAGNGGRGWLDVAPDGIPATAGTGSGGGGGATNNSGNAWGGNGGSGIVIIRYQASSAQGSGGTITTYGSGGSQYYVHTFSNAGVNYPITVGGNADNVRISDHNFEALNKAHIIGPKIGSSSIAFDGTGDYLEIPESSDFKFGAGDFTMECWINFSQLDNFDNGVITIFSSGTGVGSNYWGIAYGDGTYSQYGIGMVDKGQGPWDIWQGDEDGWSADKWYHLAISRDGSDIWFYRDGVSILTYGSFGTLTEYAAPVDIGGQNGQRYFGGYMDEIRFSNSCRYPAGTTFTPPTTAFTNDANTKLLIHSNTTMGSTTFTDSSSGGHTVTANGNIKNIAPKVGVGMKHGYAGLSGAQDSIKTPLISKGRLDVFQNGSDWTLEAWICCNTVPTGSDYFFFVSGYQDDDNKWGVAYSQAAGEKLYWYARFGGSTVVSAYSGDDGVISDTDWHHVAFTKTGGSTYTLKIYLDGTEVMSTTDTNEDTLVGDMYIGSIHSTSGGFAGFMDEVRISNTVRYTGTFTPSTTAFKDDKDTVVLLHMDGGGNIDPTTNLPTLPGQGKYFWDASTNAIFYNAIGVPTNKSLMEWDGSGDYISVVGSADWRFAGEFTVEMWANSITAEGFYSASNIMAIYGGGGGGGKNSWQLFVMGSSNPKNITFYCSADGNNWTTIDEDVVLNNGKWYHLAVTRDSSNVVHLWVNGTELGSGTSFVGTMATPSSYDLLSFGGRTDTGANPYDGTMDQIRISDTARYTSTFTPSTTPFTTDANTKLLIQSDFSEGGLGADHSSNYNYFTPTNLVASDMMIDSPSNNFATWNKLFVTLQATQSTYKEGNLEVVSPAGSDLNGMTEGTIGIPSSGKWYWENYTDNANYQLCGIASVDFLTSTAANNYMGYGKSRGYMSSNGQKVGSGVYTAYGNTWTTGDIIGVAVDMDNGAIYFAKNNTWQDSGDPTSGASKTGAAYTDLLSSSDFDSGIMPAWSDQNGATTDTTIGNFGQDSSFAGNKTSQGNQDGNDKGDFYYAPPSGYLALCTQNLADPLITLPTEHFETIGWTGDGTSGAMSTTGLSFQPDFFFQGASDFFGSTSGGGAHLTYDVLRGFGDDKEITTDSTKYEGEENASEYGFVSGVTSSGVTYGQGSLGVSSGIVYYNTSGAGYVSWNWKAGGTGVSNGDGTITSTVSANTTAGISLVKYTGTGSNSDTVGHGLGVVPEMIIVKAYESGAQNWIVWHKNLTATTAYSLYLNTTTNQLNNTSYFYPTAPNATKFWPGDGGATNGSGIDTIAYCFNSIQGYSRVGSYEGNGSTDGPFIFTDFTPAFLIVKNADASSTNWRMYDNKRPAYNPESYVIYANTSGAGTSTGHPFDFVSNGAKVRGDWQDINTSGQTYVYAMFAESPFKISNAR